MDFLSLVLTFGGLALFAAIWFAFERVIEAHKKRNQVLPPLHANRTPERPAGPGKGLPVRHGRGPEGPTSIREIAKAQEAAAALRRPKVSEAGTTYEAWLEMAISELMKMWHPMDYPAARREIEEALSLCGMVFPDTDYDWSLQAAREFAHEYAREAGEQHGSNQ